MSEPTIIPLTLFPSEHKPTLDELAADSVYQLCVAHMVSGLRVANRLRTEAGHPPLSVTDVLQVLGLPIAPATIALVALVDAIAYSNAPFFWDKEIRLALDQAHVVLGRPPL